MMAHLMTSLEQGSQMKILVWESRMFDAGAVLALWEWP